ncbi:MAG: Nif3-like dinuclear metal center hexameric protein [Pontimonas sp.]
MSKSTKPLSEVVDILESLWPSSGAEDWDAPGLVVGSPEHSVGSIHLMVDATLDSIAEAVEGGADLIVAHHPLLLRGVTTVAESTYKGRVIADLIRGGVALYSAHTNADVVPTGTSAQLANLLELTEQSTLTESATPGHGLGRVGTLPAPMSVYELAVKIGEFLPQTAVGPVVAGDAESMVSTVSVCAGAGDSLLDNPAVLSSDVYITSDLRHHPASEAREQAALVGGPSLINISHFAAEWLWLDQAAAELEKATGLSVTVSDVNTDPWSFQVHRVGG